MPKIYINARFLTQSTTGVQRYALELVRALDEMLIEGKGDAANFEFELLSPKNGIRHKLDLLKIKHRAVGVLSGHAWEQLELPFHAAGGLLFCPGNTAPILSLISGRKTVITIHDLSYRYFPKAYSLPFRIAYRLLSPFIFRLSSSLITVSETERQAILKIHREASARLYAIQNGVVSVGFLEEIRQAANLRLATQTDDVPFVLYVGSLSKRKNIDGLIEAMRLVNETREVRLVLVGSGGGIFTEQDLPLPDSLRGKVIVRGQIDQRDELLKLYHAATCFVFPSFYESFGFPPLEAMACGCPAIVANSSALPEICGDAAIYCDPYLPSDIAAKIELLVDDPSLRATLREKGLQRSTKFSWRRCATETLDVIKNTAHAA